MKKVIISLIIVLLGAGMCFVQDSVSQEAPLQATKGIGIETVQSNSDEQILFLQIAVIILAVFLIALSVMVFLNRRKLRKVVIDTITNEEDDYEVYRLQSWLDGRIYKVVENELQSDNKNELKDLLKKIEALNNRLVRIEQKPAEKPVQNATGIRSQMADNTSRIKETQGPAIQQVKKLYALNIIDGFFNKVSEQISGTPIFELTVSSPNSATFTVYHGAYATVLAAPEYLEGCDKQTLSDNPSDLEIAEGKASLSDGKWEIVQKANVKLV